MREYDPRLDKATRKVKASKKKVTATRPATRNGGARTTERQNSPRGGANGDPAEPNQSKERRVADAAEYCLSVVQDGFADATIEKASEYLSEETMKRLEREWSGEKCRALSKLAKAIIWLKSKLHEAVGDRVAWFYGLLRSSQLEGAIVREIAAKIPLPWDGKLVVAARGAQVIGISMCILSGDDLTRC